MLEFFKQRAKAFLAALIPLVILAFIQAAEQAGGFDVPADQEAGILAWFASMFGFLLVERIPNKPAA